METGIRQRPLRLPDEIDAAARLVADAWNVLGPNVSLHPGDIWWRANSRQGAEFHAFEDEGGGLVAIAECDLADASADLAVRPDLVEAAEPAVLRWLVRHLTERGRGDTVCLGAFADDAGRHSRLVSMGFARSDQFYRHFRRPLDEPLPPGSPAPGYEVRPLRTEAEIRSRVETGRRAFGGRSVTVENYRKVRGGPGYDPELDVIAVNGRDEVAAFALGWYDAITGVAEFEPVATHPDHQRRGLGRAVLREGLRRFRERGAKAAIVYTGGRNEAARGLYESIGFRVTGEDWDYLRPRV